MSDSREDFEQAFLNQYTDFERFENGEYMDDFLQQSWIGWQAIQQVDMVNAMVSNEDRAGFAGEALSHYCKVKEGSEEFYEDSRTVALDLMCDLMHYLDSVGADVDDTVAMAKMHYEEELEEEADQ